MTWPAGILSVTKTSLDDVTADNFLSNPDSRDCYEFGFRWENGEVAADVLAVRTDGYYDGPSELKFEGVAYMLDLNEEHIEDVMGGLEYAHVNGKHATAAVALRYYIEFDAFLCSESADFTEAPGGSSKRSPAEFCRVWIK